MFNYLFFIIFYLITAIILPILIILLKPLNILFGDKFNWNKLSYIILNYILCIDNEIIYKDKFIKNGYILSNHRSWFDNIYDVYITKSIGTGRYLGIMSMGFAGLLSYIENRAAIFKRGKVKRKEIFNKMFKIKKKSKYKNLLIFPEGTRNNYKEINSIEDIKSKLKFGIIKSIYETDKNLPVQLCITSNKEKVINEKKLKFNRNVKIKTCISKVIIPKNYDTLELFINAICKEWFDCYNISHN